MKKEKSYSRFPALLARATVISGILSVFVSCGSGNGTPMPEAKDDPAGIYRTYLSEIRNLNELTAAELTERLLQWRTVKDSVFACLRRDTLDPLRPYIEKACKVMHDSLRIEFSRLALSGPRTYGELLKLKERLSPYIEDQELQREARKARSFFASLDGRPAFPGDRQQILSAYRTLLEETIRSGIHGRDDLTAYIAEEDAVFRAFLAHLHDLDGADVADLTRDTQRCCSQVFLAAQHGEIAWQEAMTYLVMRTNRRMIQNARTCIDDIRGRRVAAPAQAHAYIWMLLQPYASLDGFGLALLSDDQRKQLDRIAAQTPAAFETLGRILQSDGARRDELPGMLMEIFIHTL
ncbi:Uncharacterised protein [Alistipes sp. cv1]|uniref:hypothetical protein n=1 Tax=Alistipes indistinctus TaxID=626932 RepID=UPI0006C361C9|nr:Uncharacterised protein [Faecalibacterium prausnitzii]